jgi:cell division septation protein DedD/nucleoid DNA-binding protein
MKIDVLANLETLLHHHEEVNLPGIGKLVTRQSDFSIDRSQGVILPAAKQVTGLDQTPIDNEQLIRFLAHKYGVSREEASQVVSDFAYEYKAILQNVGIDLPSIGKIMMKQTGEIYFESNQYHNYNIDYFGLPPVKNMHPLDLAKGELAAKDEEKPTQAVTKRRSSYVEIINESLPLQLMLPAIIILILTIPLSQRYAENRAGFSILSTEESIRSVPKQSEKDAISITKENLNTPPKASNTEPSTPPKVETQPEKPVINQPTKPVEPVEEEEIDSGEKHLIVLGVYGNKANAEKLEVDVFNKGYNADLVPKSNGLYQVAIILKCEKKQVATRLKAIKKDFPSAWWKR